MEISEATTALYVVTKKLLLAVQSRLEEDDTDAHNRLPWDESPLTDNSELRAVASSAEVVIKDFEQSAGIQPKGR